MADNSKLKESRDILAEMQDNVERYNKGLKDADTYTQKMANNNAKTLEAAIKLRQAQALSKKQLGSIADLSQKINDGDIDKIKSARIKKDLESQLLVAQEKGFTKQKKGLKIQLDMLNNMDEAAKLQGRINMAKEAASGLDEAFGGIGKQILDMVTNPLTGAVALLLAFNAQQEAIGDEFGAIGVTEFRDQLAGASQEFTRMGLDGKEALTSAKSLSSEFGIGFENAVAMADSVGNLAKSTALSTEESAKLVGLFTEIGGLSEEGAENLAKQAESLAVANGVAPGVVLKDIAANSEIFAKFSGVGAKGIARAAIQARKLGIELSDVAGAMDSMLDFQGSLNAEIEASVLLGRNVNLQKARELSLAGDIEGFQTEILKQVGSQAQFDKMNVIQKKALATATGMGVEQLSKMVSKEKEAVTLAGQLSKQKISDIVPEETITKTAELIASFQAMGMTLAESLGPVLNSIVGAFTMLVKGMEATVGAGPGLLGLYTAMTIAKKKDTVLSIRNAIAGYFEGASKMSSATMGFGTIAAVAIAAGAVATMLGSLASFAVGDFEQKANQKPTFTTGEGQKFSFSKNDDILAAPGLSAAVNGMGGGTVVNNTIDTSRMEKGTAQTNQKLDQLITAMIDAPKKTGKAAGKAFGGMM
tara:strand:- start:237 stop:2174 length:1938 start_codon:yes stop_codon:yes gene_type:complete